jgi:hypothetical protein
MKLNIVLTAILLTAFVSVYAQKKNEGFRFVDYIDKKQIDILYNDTLLTAYCYYDSVMKPVLFPLNTVSGITLTRGFPLAPREGERIDHPHHIGMWLNYESVNGLDFWNNSTAIAFAKRSHYGSIVHDGVVKTDTKKDKAILEVTARWLDRGGKILLRESTVYHFAVAGGNVIIDRKTTLNALDVNVDFKDVKDGFLGIRVARELEHPSNEPEIFLDNKGNATTVAAINNEGVTGEYLSSEGLKGNDVWGTRGRWVSLRGKIRHQPVSITIIDHPKNPGYPAYWHARGYGLFAVNPLGQEVFSKGKEKLNFKLGTGESVTFLYRVILHEGNELTSAEIEHFAKSF